ncbi:MAG: molybdopterin-dependent oxidoreductase [Gammaproteobacteria bacterium]|nr:molybdopterin-dependent oxidoreductase [Gammaproteobacteria bacterium]
MTILTTRRQMLASGGSLAVGLSLKYAPAAAQDPTQLGMPYARWEDLMRRKWTWDRVAHGSHGVNCTGHCAFNVYVKNGIVWREEQQGEYGRSGDDTPDYGPRGCQKGVREAAYMYGKQRVLYPMKRVGKRGEGKWQRISWEQAAREIAARFIEHATASGPDSITFAMGTMMILKRASLAALFRFCNITGIVSPETFGGVGDLPAGAHMTLGNELPGDSMAAVFKSKTCLVWMCNPAVTRIPDAHFFWEARYNGTEVITITPDFNGSALHSSKWISPKAGTDTALAMAIVQAIIDERLVDWDYVCEQTDLPFLVRSDTRKFLRGSDMGLAGEAAERTFYVWDEVTGQPVVAPATGLAKKPGPPGAPPEGSLKLGALRPAVEGKWKIRTADGRSVTVTTVFELTRQLCNADYTPEQVQAICGVHPDVIRFVARKFATARPGMIFAGYRSCKWLHGDKLQRAWLLMCALTGNTGPEGSGMQITQLARGDGTLKFVFADVGPRLKLAAISVWDYARGDGKALNENAYGSELADHFDGYYQKAISNRWLPDYSRKPWKMAFMAGHNPANWRASGTRWRHNVFEQLDCIVTMTPDMSVTAMYSDYVLPIAHTYERHDIILEGRTPYLQVLDQAVPPLGESVDDYTAMLRIAQAISAQAKAMGLAPIKDSFNGQPIEHDYTVLPELMTLNGKIRDTRDVVQFLLDYTPGLPKISFDELARKGFVRVNDARETQFGRDSPYSYKTLASTRDKVPYPTLTGRQQFYMDHDWFLAEGEQLPVHKDPLANPGHTGRLLMGHARHGIHSMWRDDWFLLNLQRGEPDIYVGIEDAQERGVGDGDLVRVFNNHGSFIAMAHLSAGLRPGELFMYHGWDPMMFRNRQNFSAVISTGGLLKPTSLVGDYGHLGYRVPNYVPNLTFHDTTVSFEKYEEAARA